MKMIVGLGNPGQEYAFTRHNIGFITIDELARRWSVTGWKKKMDAQVAECPGKGVLLVKPETFMNNSGVAVGAVARWYKLAPSDIVVLSDDLDLPCGKLRIRLKGGTGGHRGLESIIVHLGDADFIRVRLGIGRPPAFMSTPDYVLGRFRKEEQELVADAVDRACKAVEAILSQGPVNAMNEYNRG